MAATPQKYNKGLGSRGGTQPSLPDGIDKKFPRRNLKSIARMPSRFKHLPVTRCHIFEILRKILGKALYKLVHMCTINPMALPARNQIRRILTPDGLQAAIQAKQISRVALAKLAGMHRASLYRYLKGDIPLSNRKLNAVWEALVSYKK